MNRLEKNITVVAACALFALTREASPSPALTLLAGLAIASALEYAYHRQILHGKTSNRLKREHVAHHRAFPRGERVQRSDPRVEHLVEHPAVFPVGFFAIYCALASVGLAYRELLLAMAIHYALFEVAHWGTHVRDNAVDRRLLRVPMVGALRARMIEHHLSHHRRPDGDFSVLPPYGPDFVFGTKR